MKMIVIFIDRKFFTQTQTFLQMVLNLHKQKSERYYSEVS